MLSINTCDNPFLYNKALFFSKKIFLSKLRTSFSDSSPLGECGHVFKGEKKAELEAERYLNSRIFNLAKF